MDTSKLCFGCFSEHDGVGPCPHCGFDLSKVRHPFVALPIGTILNGRYLTGRVLGVGGFGVTYLAFDMTLEICVAVKEYLPSGIALRDSDHYTMTVTAPEEQPKFDTGASKFLEEARLLAKLRDVPNIVTVHDYFRENGTAYFVMEYIEGVDLMKYTKQKGGKLSYDEALRILLPIIESLAHVHRHNLLHRDISPDNIVVMSNGQTRLLDFGAARLAIDSDKSKSIILKHGFAPEEQYRKHGNQGPWSDEYALAATMYLIITGVMPPDAIERVHEDTLESPLKLGVSMPQYANDALMKALSVSASGRFPDMNSFAAALSGKPAEPDEQMVGGKTVMIEEEVSEKKPLPVSEMETSTKPIGFASQQPANVAPQQPVSPAPQPNAPYMPQQAVQTPINNYNMPVSGQFPAGTTVTTPNVPKKSIWKRPLTYIIAGIIALAGIGTAVGVYIVKNYEWGDPPHSSVTRKTKETTDDTDDTSDTDETTPPTIPDPQTQTNGDDILYVDQVRHFSVSASKEYAFENRNGLFVFERNDRSLMVTTDMITGFGDLRVASLTDFIAQSDEVAKEYLEDGLSLTDVEIASDYFFIHSLKNSTAVELSGVAYQNGKRMDVTILAYERKEDEGVFINCGFMPTDEYGMYSSDDLETISSVLLSFTEDSSSTSDYEFFDVENRPSILYRKTDTDNITDVKMGSVDALRIHLSNVSDPDSSIYVLSIGDQGSITAACTSTEQALGAQFKFGGYTSVTPTINSNLEMRIRNYTLAMKDNNDKPLECTSCVINLNGTYYAVIATCGDEDDREQVALNYTLTIRSLIRSE
ncbi:MAG: serine/threonine protein kinase [Clostridiales bacterium]|nr:serine/threonine protein kinase [Clostridiales bacterium]